MPSLETRDTTLSHVECLHRMGGIFDTDITHIGNPRSYVLSPCCEHGYRAIFSARPVLDFVRPTTSGDKKYNGLNWWGATNPDDTPRAFVDRQPHGSPLEGVWNWWDVRGIDSPLFFTTEQRQGREGSWALISGAVLDEAGTPVGAETTWWAGATINPGSITSFTSIDPNNAQTTTTPYARVSVFDYFRESLIPESEVPSAGSITYGASGSDLYIPGHSGFRQNIPQINRSRIDPQTTYWVLYGARKFLGITKCTDNHAGQPWNPAHGSYPNWFTAAGEGESRYVNEVIEPTDTAQGGYTPKIIFFGGDLMGAAGDAVVSDNGDITGITMTDTGITVVSDLKSESIDPPKATVNMPDHYFDFEATAKVSTDYDEIKELLPGMVKTKSQMIAELCDGYNDPIAQTFLVDGTKHPDGVYVPSIDVSFASKPKYGVYTPVFLEIRPTLNGYPHAEKVMASKYLYPSKINVSPGVKPSELPLPPWVNPVQDNQSSDAYNAERNVYLPDFDNQYGYSRFEFPYPIYLEPGEEYAIVVRSNDSDYKCWIADVKGHAIVGGQSLANYDDDGYEKPSGTYSKQYGGSFFRSQNGRTWSADQNQDLMFRINQCDFGGSKVDPKAATFYLSAGFNTTEFDYDRIKLNAFSRLIPGRSSTKVTGTVKTAKASDPTTLVEHPQFGSMFNESEQTRTVDLPERMRISGSKAVGDASIQMDVTLSTTNPDVSPAFDLRNIYAVPIQNHIDGGSLKSESINILETGVGYSVSDVFTVTGGGSTTNATFNPVVDGSGSITGTTIVSGGTGFHLTDSSDPISISGGSGTGATFEILSEEGQAGGNSKMRYVTRPINLAPGMSARAIKVFLSAKQPHKSSIYVYYKALAEEDAEDINRKKWKLMKRVTPDEDFFSETASSFAINNAVGGFREYEFETDEIVSYTTDAGVTYDNFKTFAIKIVCFAQNQARPPIIKDFRSIAVF